MLNDNKNMFMALANNIDGWKTQNKNDLAKAYLNNKNNELGEYYLSAIILRYWKNIYKYYDKNPHFDYEDYLDWLIEAIQRAFDYCYKEENGNITNDPNGPDKAINKSIQNVILNHYYLSEMDKRAANYNKSSLDVYLEDFDESWIDSVVASEEKESISACNNIIQQYINNKNFMDAIILDNICYQDSLKNNKFNMRKLVNNITNINDNYIDYLVTTYDNISENEIKETIKSINNLSNSNNYNNTKLYKYVEKLLTKLRYNKEVNELLCY